MRARGWQDKEVDVLLSRGPGTRGPAFVGFRVYIRLLSLGFKSSMGF